MPRAFGSGSGSGMFNIDQQPMKKASTGSAAPTSHYQAKNSLLSTRNYTQQKTNPKEKIQRKPFGILGVDTQGRHKRDSIGYGDKIWSKSHKNKIEIEEDKLLGSGYS